MHWLVRQAWQLAPHQLLRLGNLTWDLEVATTTARRVTLTGEAYEQHLRCLGQSNGNLN